ncbi:uncharacterized protein [Haliotis cracherodii]|uniref:uncharacterized protein n=1 Tax=Haliotis cracherodii TaxID=6455 RepID=UPI0039EC3229
MDLTFFLLCSLLSSVTYCAIELTVTPEAITLGNDAKLVIRCSLNLRLSKTDQVYSVMMKRRNTALVVIFTDSTTNVYDETLKNATVNSSLSTSDAYVQLTFPTVTCNDRGNYSCSMAVRQNHRSLKLGPVEEYLKITGESCRFIDTFIYPMSAYKIGDMVRITCFMLVQYATSDWHWYLANNETVYKSEEGGCQFVAEGVMNCSSLLEYEVYMSSTVTCQLGNAYRTVTIDVEDNVVEDTDSMSMKPQQVDQTLPSTPGHVTHINYTTYMLVGLCSVVTIATLLIVLRTISNRRQCSSEDNHIVKEEEVQLSKRHITNLHLFTKEEDTIDICETLPLTSSEKSDHIL